MKEQLRALQAEILKNRHSPIRWFTFVAFALAPVFGGLMMLIMKNQGLEGLSGTLRDKAVIMSFQANWGSYLAVLSQAVGVGGVLVFGFVVSWLFGREYAEGTAKDLLALPISRAKILNAKFAYYLMWCLSLALSNLFLGLLIGFGLQLEGWNAALFQQMLGLYFTTTLLVILANVPVAFFALWGKGYLAPLGVVCLLLVFSQIMGAMGLGTWFPWAVPGLYSGSGGEGLKAQLDGMSFSMVGLTGLAGYLAAIWHWNFAPA